MANTTNIGIPPYIQQNSSGDNLSLNTFDPETGTEMQALNRKQQIANLLVQQSLQPRQGQMVGNVYVPAGWGQGLAQVGQALAGAYMTKKHDQARSALQDQNQQNVANAMTAYQESQQGRPALTVPEGSQGPERPEMPATPESQRAGLVRLLTNQNPSVQRFAQYEAQRQAKMSELKAQQEQAMALEAAKAKAAIDQKRTLGADKEAELAQQASNRTSLSKAEQEKLDLEKAALAQKAQQYEGTSGADQLRAQTELAKHGTASGDAQLAAETALTKHNTTSADTLSGIDARAQLQRQELAHKQAALDQQHERERQQLELERSKFANTQEYQKAEQGLKERQLAQTAELKQAELAQQSALHDRPSGNALAAVDVQAQQSLQQHNDRVAQMEQNARQDQATLELRRQQGLSEEQYKRDKMAMDERHAKAQEQLTREGHAIQEAFHKAQTSSSKAPPGYRPTANGNLEAIPGGPADVKQQNAQNKVDAGRENVNNLVMTLRDHYDQLDQMGGITNPDKGVLDNLAAGAGSSGVGQFAGRMFGTQTQSLRNQIAQQRPLLLNAIKEATGMSAKQMDSNAELKMYLSAATDPTLDVKANRAALDMLDKLYGLGGQAPAAGSSAPPAATSKGGPAKITSDADYNALPSGTVFIAPDGKQRRKP